MHWENKNSLHRGDLVPNLQYLRGIPVLNKMFCLFILFICEQIYLLAFEYVEKKVKKCKTIPVTGSEGP
jgi:hypothetical protein